MLQLPIELAKVADEAYNDQHVNDKFYHNRGGKSTSQAKHDNKRSKNRKRYQIAFESRRRNRG
jgi:hypothetical protein